jgi:glucan phosphoethanolaminetransferase (alkaline phosphatase superfamily)
MKLYLTLNDSTNKFSMRGINYLAGFGTILLFIGVYSFKAAFYKKTFKEETEKAGIPMKSHAKVLLIFFSVFCFVLGLFLIAKSLKIF